MLKTLISVYFISDLSDNEDASHKTHNTNGEFFHVEIWLINVTI